MPVNTQKKFSSTVWEQEARVRVPALRPPFAEKPPFQAVFLRFLLCFAVWLIDVQRWFQGQKSGESMSEDSRRNRQIPNPSLISVTAVFFIANTTNS